MERQVLVWIVPEQCQVIGSDRDAEDRQVDDLTHARKRAMATSKPAVRKIVDGHRAGLEGGKGGWVANKGFRKLALAKIMGIGHTLFRGSVIEVAENAPGCKKAPVESRKTPGRTPRAARRKQHGGSGRVR